MFRKLNVLCVEDDPADREALRGYCDILDWEVTLASSCMEGFGCASARSFDVIVTDLNMPDCSGLEMVTKIRAVEGPNSATPVLLNSWGLSESVVQIAQSLSINAMLAKPILLSAFKSELQKLEPCPRG